jgi:large subunit ribosomal protein L22
MEILSVYRGARISAFKVRELTREIQGLPVAAALDLIAFSTKKAAMMVGKTLKSAIANAENNNELKADTLVVKEATVGEGPTMKRIKSRARGSASTIRKRTSHIRIVLSDEIVIPQRKPKASAAAKKRQKSGAAAGKTPKTAKAPKAAAPAAIETETPAEPASQENEGPGETPAAPVESSDTDTTKF